MTQIVNGEIHLVNVKLQHYFLYTVTLFLYILSFSISQSLPKYGINETSLDITIKHGVTHVKPSWLNSITPVIGRVIWCVNESRQKWTRVNKNRVTLLDTGKFICPQPNQTEDMKYCCGALGQQICCKITDTPGLRWGIPLGVIVCVIVFLTVSYTIQVFRACDRCYHECPIIKAASDDADFQWDTRWYTVSHEGNRYGVTFHSRLFANEFMKCLEKEYGRWNTANILKIQRDGQNFVILNIFFHDLFTPWFYTQGPIKNDEEWIRTDFKNICLRVQATLAMEPRLKRKRKKQEQNLPNQLESYDKPIEKTENFETKSTIQQNSPWTPWTKVTYMPTCNDNLSRKSLTRSQTRNKYKNKTDNPKSAQPVTMFILEDLIECNGLEKGVQTRQKKILTLQQLPTTTAEQQQLKTECFV